ncbi:putative death-receptor fusion protein-domain-containing protein [Lipomyces oligophaga]|uniref:putative death-receptor fusion protein-domain-containing protein n=1 Tax=Lipomyces oligophaga TaxID=45792 RepID=UPI0034CDDDD5
MAVSSQVMRILEEQKYIEEKYISESDLTAIRKYLVKTKVEQFVGKEDIALSLIEIYPVLFRSLLNSPTLGDYRTISCDTLSVWIQRANQCCTHSPKFQDSFLNAEFIDSKADSDLIFDFVCTHWTDSGAALGNALRELFVKTISLLERVWTRDERDERLVKWVHIVLKFPRTMRVVYFVVEILARQIGGWRILHIEPDLLRDSLKLTYSNALANPISKMITAILLSIRRSQISQLNKKYGKSVPKSQSDKELIDWLQIWNNLIVESLRNEDTRAHILTYLLPNIFKISSSGFKNFIVNLEKISNRLLETDTTVLVGCLKVGQDLGFLDDVSKGEELYVLSPQFLEYLLHHYTQGLRIGGLSLAVSSPQVSRPIRGEILTVLRNSLDDLILESDPEFRNRVFGLMRQLITRLRDSSYALTREKRKLQSKLEDSKRAGNDMVEVELQLELTAEVIKANMKFLQDYLNYLFELMRPGSSYQRTFMGLKLLHTLVRSGLDNRISPQWHDKNHLDFPFHISIFNHASVRILLDNLANNYEDIRALSETILKMAPVESLFVTASGIEINHTESVIDGYIEVGLRMITGLRGREGDGGARVIDLCYYLLKVISTTKSLHLEFLDSLLSSLDQSIAQAEINLPTAVRDFPLHGYFASLRLIFEQADYTADHEYWIRTHKRIVDIAYRVWDIVEPILSHNSPEGNLPEEIEDNYIASLEESFGPATQVILSYAWRAVGESSSMLTVLLTRIPNTNKQPLIMPSDVSRLGNLLLSELATIRHRGAFSSVYPTFVACCSRCNIASWSDELVSLPNKWLEENILLIQAKAQSITRRSGGIPYLIAGVLTAETNSMRPLLTKTFDRLAEIAVVPVYAGDEGEKMDLPQVHAFNSIRTIFIETKLSSASAFFIDRALAIAIEAFASEVWSIRNCGVMLFAALQARLFGSRKFTDSRATVGSMSARLFFSRFKSIKPVLLRHLSEHVSQFGDGDSHIETVYPVLSLLSRLEATTGDSGLDAFYPLVMNCLASRIWKIREVAARSLVALISSEIWTDTFISLVQSLTIVSSNTQHGRLLALQNLLKSSFAKEPTPELYDSLISVFGDVSRSNCLPVSLTFLRVCSSVIAIHSTSSKREELRLLLWKVVQEQDFSENINQAGSKLFRNQVSEFFAERILCLSEDVVKQLRRCLESNNYSVRQGALNVVLSSVDSISLEICTELIRHIWRLVEKEKWTQLQCLSLQVFSSLKLRLLSTDADLKLPPAEDQWQVLYSRIQMNSFEENSVEESVLETLGLLASQIMESRQSVSVFNQWFSAVLAFCDDNCTFPKRQAALKSIFAFLNSIRSDSFDSEKLKVYFRLLDFQSDDDEDLREMASIFICRSILDISPSTPSLVEAKFSDWIVARFSALATIEQLSAELTNRILSDRSTAPSALEQTTRALMIDTALFIIEKQNLYRNEVHNIALFSHMLSRVLATNPSIAAATITRLRAWLKQGCIEVPRKLEGLGTDGPLGWSTGKEDIFLVGRRMSSVSKIIGDGDLSSLESITIKLDLHPLWLK